MQIAEDAVKDALESGTTALWYGNGQGEFRFGEGGNVSFETFLKRGGSANPMSAAVPGYNADYLPNNVEVAAAYLRLLRDKLIGMFPNDFQNNNEKLWKFTVMAYNTGITRLLGSIREHGGVAAAETAWNKSNQTAKAEDRAGFDPSHEYWWAVNIYGVDFEGARFN